MQDLNKRRRRREYKIIELTSEQVEDIIKKHYENLGISIESIVFKTNYRNKIDEWGMNPHTEAYFKGATIKEITSVIN